MENIFIFTEIVNCGKIGKIALESFHKYHDHKVHVYGTKKDFEWISMHPNNIFIEVDQKIIDGFNYGHRGTALLWESAILHTKSDKIIHFDSDTIFRANMFDDMIKISDEYDIIGPVRNYHYNPCGRNDIRHLADLCQTNCILFKKSKINLQVSRISLKDMSLFFLYKYSKYVVKRFLTKTRFSTFSQKIHGSYPLYKWKTLDFFDQVMFDMIGNGAKVFHLNFDEVGGCDNYGKRDNIYKDINNFPTPYKIDFGKKLVHFSCVGSGMNFFTNKDSTAKTDSSYVECALDRYALFCKIFYKEDLGITSLDKYETIINIEKWY